MKLVRGDQCVGAALAQGNKNRKAFTAKIRILVVVIMSVIIDKLPL